MEKVTKERIEYLDFVRAIAVILIIITHYNAAYVFGREVPAFEKCIITEFPFGIYVGDLGVSLFLIISGAALMYVYEEKLELVKFYKKRFIAIFPMFWMAYIVAVLPKLGVWKNAGIDIPRWRILVTLVGMDGYLSEFGQGFYVLGEWFLGFIILFYMVFPLLRTCMAKNEALTWIMVIIAYIITLKYYDFNFEISKFIFARLPELCFGMSFMKHRVNPRWYMVIPAFAVLAVNTLVQPRIMRIIPITYVGIAMFVAMVFVSNIIKGKKIRTVCSWLSKYSYAIFLVHYVIIEYIQAYFDLDGITIIKNYILFVITFIVILIIAYILQGSHDYIFKVKKSGA